MSRASKEEEQWQEIAYNDLMRVAVALTDLPTAETIASVTDGPNGWVMAKHAEILFAVGQYSKAMSIYER